MTAPVIPMRTPPTCGCCRGTGTVPDAVGEPRPCSRCCSEAFDRWSSDKRAEDIARRGEAAMQKVAGQ